MPLVFRHSGLVRSGFVRSGVACCAILVVVPPLGAQSASPPPPAPARRAFTHADLVAWKTVRNAQLSNDGRWFAYQLAPNEGDAEAVLRSVADGREVRVPIGEPPAGAGAAPNAPAVLAFSGDGEWLAVTTYPTQAEARRLRREHRPAQNGVVVLHTGDGQQRRFDRVRRAAFAGPRPAYVILQAYPTDAPASAIAAASAPPPATGLPGGTPTPPAPLRVDPADLLIHRLGTESVLTVGSVGEFAPDSSGAWLAYTIEGRDPQGNGVQLHELRTGAVRVLDSRRAVYRRLAWNDSLPQLAVLRGAVDTVAHDTTYAVLGFQGFGGARSEGPRTTTVALAGRADAPAGMRISPDRTPRWTEAGDGLLFGLRERRPAAPRDSAPDEDRANLIVWHWKEPRLQSQQIVQEQADRTFSYLAAYWTGPDRVVALADTAVRQVTMLPHDRWAVGVDTRTDERRGNLEGLPRVDYAVIDPRTGARRAALRSIRQGPTLPSPDGRRLLFFADGDFHVLDLATLERRNLTAGAPVPFWDAEDDHNVEKPATTPVGWTTDGSAVLLSDNWDVWRVPAGSTSGGAPVNLTRTGAQSGRQQKIRYQRRLVIDPRVPGIDPRQPLYVSMYGERTKKGGLARVDVAHGGVSPVIFDDAAFAPRRARDADVWLTTRGTFTEVPDWWRLDGGRLTTRLTNTGAQLAAFKWSSGTRVVDYVCANGDSLQATVFLPADYAPGTRVPTVVTFYEKMSQNRHVFTPPSEVNGVMIHPGMFASRGYAVVMPDITYRVNDPGVNAVGCMVPAVRAAVASGVVDSARVGIQGHSWSGYQTAFIVTQTPIFRAAVAGAPLTDMVSMYSSIYWNTGSANQGIFQSSQGRFKGNFLSNWDAYVRNSPNRFADRVVTPLLMLHNDRDGAVDFNQGITFYNTLKQLGKPVILLEYPGENHGLAQRGNQKDYQQRLAEWFDVQLRGAPAPDWIARGIPRLEMEDYMRQRRTVVARPAPTVAPAAPAVPGAPGRTGTASGTGQ